MSKPETILNGDILLNVVAAGGRPAATRSLRTEVPLTTRGTSFLFTRRANLAGPIGLGVLHWAYFTGPSWPNALGLWHWNYRTGPA
jgi:hypothetical protein